MNKISNGQVLIGVLVLYLVNTLLVNIFITDQLLHDSYSGVLSVDMISKIIAMRDQFWWLGYLLTFILIPLKTLISVSCVWAGTVFQGYEVSFRKIWRFFLFGEFVFIAYSYFKLLIMYSGDFETIEQVNSIHPMSLYVLSSETSPTYLHYLLTALNLFEVIYCLVLTTLLSSVLEMRWLNSFVFLMKTYGLGLLLWICIMVFLMINLFPE